MKHIDYFHPIRHQFPAVQYRNVTIGKTLIFIIFLTYMMVTNTKDPEIALEFDS